MSIDSGQFADVIAGYFRENCESEFPWHVNDRSVWYALLVVEGGRIVRHGFTSSTANKVRLCAALERLTDADETLLLGIWNGQYSTHLFVLDPAEALAYLKGSKKWARFGGLRNARNVEKICGPKGGFKSIRFDYDDESGVAKHGGSIDREEAEELEACFRTAGIVVTEKRYG